MHGYQHSSIQMGARTYAGVARFFSRLEMIEPGIVPIGRWCPEGVDPTQPGVTPLPAADPSTAPKMPAAGYAAVGREK